MRSIKNVRGIPDDLYQNALDVECGIVSPLDQVGTLVEEALIGLDEWEVDNPEQREYIKLQVQDILYRLKQVQDKLEG